MFFICTFSVKSGSKKMCNGTETEQCRTRREKSSLLFETFQLETIGLIIWPFWMFPPFRPCTKSVTNRVEWSGLPIWHCQGKHIMMMKKAFLIRHLYEILLPFQYVKPLGSQNPCATHLGISWYLTRNWSIGGWFNSNDWVWLFY